MRNHEFYPNLRIRESRRGVTLIELLLAVTVSAALLLTIVALITVTLSARIKSQSAIDVEDEGRFATEVISQAIRNSSGIAAPAAGSESSSLTLSFTDSSKNPTVFSVNQGRLYVTEGSSSAVPLTSGRVLISNLSFWNRSKNGTPGSIQYSFRLERVNTAGKNEYDYARIFRGAASLR